MLSRNEVKYIQSLCHKKQRQQEGVFIAEGPKIIKEILLSDYRIIKIYAIQAEAEHYSTSHSNVVAITENELKNISVLQTPNKVLALVEQKKEEEQIDLHNQWTLMLDDIQDPGNFGTIIRIADWFGIKNIICSNGTADLYNPKVIQSTMGSFTHVNIFYKDLKSFLQNNVIAVYGAVLNGTNIFSVNKNKEGIVLIGNEGKGINKELQQFINQPVTIPKIGNAESLNAAIATGIIISQLLSIG